MLTLTEPTADDRCRQCHKPAYSFTDRQGWKHTIGLNQVFDAHGGFICDICRAKNVKVWREDNWLKIQDENSKRRKWGRYAAQRKRLGY